MADARLQQLRRSISSWSLSTIKKPKVTLPKLKKPKLKLFSGGKTRVNQKDEAATAAEVKAALLKVEGGDEGQDGQEGTGSAAEEMYKPSTSGNQEEGDPSFVLTVHHGNTPPPQDPPPPPSPGLLAPNDHLEFIDSDDQEAIDGVCEAVSPEVEYNDEWFDARGTLTRSKDNLTSTSDHCDEMRATKYYDAVEGTALQKDTGTGTDTGSREAQRSVKAREWVKSYNEDDGSRTQELMQMQKAGDPSSLPKSRSEIRLDSMDEPPEKWSKRDEIKLNTTQGDKLLHQEGSTEIKEQDGGNKQEPEKENVARKESLKKVFQVRGKLSLKPIIDSQRSNYTKADRVLASTPYALANTSPTIQPSNNKDSLDVSDDGINCSSGGLKPGGGHDISSSSAQASPNQNVHESISKAEETLQKSEKENKDEKLNSQEPDKEDHVNEKTVLSRDDDKQDITETLADEKEGSPATQGMDGKSETKKKKIPGASIPKSIKNFAGSIFSQQTTGKGKKEGGEEKEKKERRSPFTKAYLLKGSSKPKTEVTVQADKDTKTETELPTETESKSKTQTAERATVILSDATTDVPDSCATLEKDDNDNSAERNDKKTSEVLPDLLPTAHGPSAAKDALRASPERLAYLSPIDSDEHKSISHESSPGLDTSFVEEDGLRLRKDALQVIKSMENDDAATHFYSFLTTSEYHTPPREVEDKTNAPQTSPEPQAKPVLPEPAESPADDPTHAAKPETEVKHDSTEEENEVKEEQKPTTQIASQTETITQVEDNTHKESMQEVAEKNSGKEPSPSSAADAFVTPQATVAEADDPKIPSSDISVQEHSSQVAASTVSCDPVPTEVPKLKLGSVLPVENEEPPKPSPRIKKGRYGSSTAGAKAAQTTSPAQAPTPAINNAVNLNGNAVSNGTAQNSADNTTMATFPRRHAQTKQKMEHERTSSDSGYVGPASSCYYDGISNTNTDSEPIYWEISDTNGVPPQPSPRGKKGQQTPPASNGDSSPSTSSQVGSKPVPEWINNRAPIPSPRTKKQRSLQSLPTVVPAEESMEEVKKKLQLLSQKPPKDDAAEQRPARISVREGDQFYSGKAASISYGFTLANQVARAPAVPPSPPLRGRKASQMSLPAAMAAEEMLSRQQQRRSMHETQINANTGRSSSPPQPQYVRRRRTDPIQGLHLRTIKNAIQGVGKRMIGLTDLLLSLGLPQEASVKKSEELLTDVLYSVHSLMGMAAGGMWAVGGGGMQGSYSRTCVSVEQVQQVLQAAFHVTHDTMDRIMQEVRGRPAPEVKLHLTLKEAKDLRPKTVKGTTNPYVTVMVPSTGQSHRTRMERDTLHPKWNQEFTLLLKNLQKDTVEIEVWHEHDAVTVKQLTAVRDIRALGRLVKGTTAQAQHQAAHLLGHITLNVKDISQRGLVDDWYTLEKKRTEGDQVSGGGDLSIVKERGTVHIVVNVSSSSAQLGLKDRHSFDSLLARLIHQQLTATDNNNEESEWCSTWRGQVSGAASAALSQYAITLDLSDADIQLSWWRVGSQVTNAEPAWLLSQLHLVQTALGKGAYNGEALSELRESLASFVRERADRLKDLFSAFPPASGILAQSHLTSTLKALQTMQTHPATRCLLDQEDLPDLHQVVYTSLATHTKNWWNMTIEPLRGVKTADEQISRVINIVAEAHEFLTYIADFYNPIFMKEMNIAYMETTYLNVSKKINPCVRPLVMNIYNRMPALGTEAVECTDDATYALDVGTSLWQLYRNLGRLHMLGECLPVEMSAESGVCEYHRWFSRGVMRWLELAVCKAMSMIGKAVELDTFEPVDSHCSFSSSATDTIGIFHDVKNWWVKLAWPDPENSAVLLAKILEDVCSCGTKYSDLLREKVQSMFHQESSTRVFITKQICVGLNNIDRVRQELTRLPDIFDYEDLLDKVRHVQGGRGLGAAAQLKDTVDRLISSAAENMETKVIQFVETVIGRMTPTLENAVIETCETQSSDPLLSHTLDPTLDLLKSHLNTSNFQRFLWRTWEVTLDIFHANIMRNAERRKANYFGGVYNILEETLKFFTPGEGMGLDRNAAQTSEYKNLVELLESLRKTSESLIASYYQERYEEQVEDILPKKAQLVVKMLFTRPGRLIVEVIMARDMVVEGDTGSIGSSSRYHHHTHHGPVDSYVKVQPVPAEWFPAAPIHKTKTQRKQDPAVYEETFEYEMGQNDDGVRGGFLLLTLKDYNLGRSNTFIGEAVVPLANLPCVDSSLVHTVPNTYLKMTTPGLDIGYKSLRALQFRTGDRIATSFLKKVSKRLPDPKPKSNTTLRPEDDKSRSKSPAFKERLKFS